MQHLRIVAPAHEAEHALDLLNASPSVINLIYLERAAQKPMGDVILCDVARTYFAGVAGVLSLISAKSGALIGVLISVTTIPSAANIGVAAALGDVDEWLGAMGQLSLNLVAIVLAGVGTLYIQRRFHIRRRRRKHPGK